VFDLPEPLMRPARIDDATTEELTTPLSMRWAPAQLAEAEEIAERFGLGSRSAAIRMCFERGAAVMRRDGIQPIDTYEAVGTPTAPARG
jgi:hypothetical protein